MFFISPFRFTKERLNTSIDTSKKNDDIKTHPAIVELQGEEIIYVNLLIFTNYDIIFVKLIIINF